MTIYSIGDQARAFALQTASHRLKTTLETLTREMASGEVSDVAQRLQGNTQILNRIEAQILLTEQRSRNAAEAAAVTGGVQDVLESVSTQTKEIGLSLVAQPLGETTALLQMRASAVAGVFENVVSRLNGSVGGRFLFSGQHSDAPALISAPAILDTLEAATAGLTSAQEVMRYVSDWFDAPVGGGGYIDVAYRGTTSGTTSFSIMEGEAAHLETTAASPAITTLLKGLALASLVDRGVLAGQFNEQREMMQQGGQIIVDNAPDLFAEMGRVGSTQQLIERAQTENAATVSALQTSRNAIRLADPYETAGALTQVESQLEALYAVTARLSNLKLVDYLR